MKTCLRISSEDYQSIKGHLFPEDGKEAIAFALCGRAQAEDRLVFIVHEVLLIPYGRCNRGPDYLHWKTEDVVPLMNKAMVKHMAIMRIHSHPGGCPFFSKYDLATDEEFFGNLMAGWCEDGLSHLSVIMIPGGRVLGRVYHANGSVQQLDQTFVVGEKIQFATLDDEQDDAPPEEALRNIQAFGEGIYNTFKRLRIGIVGCSGTGCHVIEQLMRMQVGELILVDPDTIETKNLNRLIGVGKDDIGKLKVEFYKNYVERMRLGVSVKAFPSNLCLSDEARRALSTCDVLFGCVDSASGRMLMNTISAFYLIPYIDIGVLLDADGKGGVSYVGAQADYLIPGKSSHVSRGTFNVEDARAEMEKLINPDLYARHLKENYIRNVQVERPAVISIDGFISYQAVLTLIDRLVSYRQELKYAKVTTLLSSDDIVKRSEDDFKEDLYLKKYKGRGDMVPYLNMPGFG